MKTKCVKCGCELTKDEKALNKKMISKKVREFMCINCLAEYLNTSDEILKEKIEQFKEEGCELFI